MNRKPLTLANQEMKTFSDRGVGQCSVDNHIKLHKTELKSKNLHYNSFLKKSSSNWRKH